MPGVASAGVAMNFSMLTSDVYVGLIILLYFTIPAAL
jgi:hypothetical protein